MEFFNNYTGKTNHVGSNNRLLGLWRYAMVLLVCCCFGASAFAQTTVVFPDANTNCVSNDMQVTKASLGESCVPCGEGENLLESLVLEVYNSTNSTRRAFAYWAKVEITNPDGTIQPLIDISGCQEGPWGGRETRDVTGVKIPFECGSTIRLINVFLAWTDAADLDRNKCPAIMANPNGISPKCGRPAEIRVSTPPAAPLLTVTQPTCAVPTGTITIANTTGLVFSVNNGPFAAYPVGGYTGLAPGAYSIRSRNIDNCISPAANTTIVAALGNPAAPALTIVQPTCAVPTGSITLSPVAGLEYRLNMGAWGAYPAGGWTGLAPGNYTVGARRTADNTCMSSSPATIVAALGNPPAPVLTVVQPTCGTPTGSITLSPVTGLQYRLNDGMWGAYPANGWTGLAPGNYTVGARRIADNTCTSSAPATINSVPDAPKAPKLTVVQPTCETPTGSITLSPYAGLEYRLNMGTWGAYPAGGWTGLAPGNYTVGVRRTSDNTCTNSASATINAALGNPDAPVLTTVQPTCDVLTGSITLTPEAGLQYRFNAGAWGAYPAGGWTGLAPGIYTVDVRRIADNTCTNTASATLYAAENCFANEGCTLGYWKNHTDRWACYETGITFGSIFTAATGDLANLTLLEALNLGGGGLNNLARQGVAALLNACHNDVDYPLSTAQVIAIVNDAIIGVYNKTSKCKTAGCAASYLDDLNNAGCPLGGTRATSLASQSSSSLQGLAESNELRAYPTPFSDKAVIEFTVAQDERFSMRLYDMRGALVRELKVGEAKAGMVNTVEVDGGGLPEGMYIARMVSDSGTKTIKLLKKE